MSNSDPFASLDSHSPEAKLREAVKSALEREHGVVTEVSRNELRALQQKLGLGNEVTKRIVGEELGVRQPKRSAIQPIQATQPIETKPVVPVASTSKGKSSIWKVALPIIGVIVLIATISIVYGVTRDDSVDSAQKANIDPSASASSDTPGPDPKILKALALQPPSKGPDNAEVTIVEYANFQCPFSRRAESVVRQIFEESGQRIRLVFRHFPLASMPQSPLAAEAAVAAHRQGKFWEMHGKLFELQGKIDRATIERAARELGLDMAIFRQDLDSGIAKAVVERDRAMGMENRLVPETPTFIVNGKRNESVETLKSNVAELLGIRPVAAAPTKVSVERQVKTPSKPPPAQSKQSDRPKARTSESPY